MVSIRCLKCGDTTNRHTSFHNGSSASGWRSRSCAYRDHNTASGEHLHRYCRTCGYDWTEEVWGIEVEANVQNNQTDRKDKRLKVALIMVVLVEIVIMWLGTGH